MRTILLARRHLFKFTSWLQPYKTIFSHKCPDAPIRHFIKLLTLNFFVWSDTRWHSQLILDQKITYIYPFPLRGLQLIINIFAGTERNVQLYLWKMFIKLVTKTKKGTSQSVVTSSWQASDRLAMSFQGTCSVRRYNDDIQYSTTPHTANFLATHILNDARRVASQRHGIFKLPLFYSWIPNMKN